jgi:N-acetylglucosamine kinase-like BadF-type ATPase
MSDGRAPRGALYEIVRAHFALQADLDLCAAVYGQSVAQRSQFSQLCRLVAQAASAGDALAGTLFEQAGVELAAIINAVRQQLRVPETEALRLSNSGGMFQLGELLRAPLRSALSAAGVPYQFIDPRLSPGSGAALQAARLGGFALGEEAVTSLAGQAK